jgi:hypothetical protein
MLSYGRLLTIILSELMPDFVSRLSPTPTEWGPTKQQLPNPYQSGLPWSSGAHRRRWMSTKFPEIR